MVLNSPMENSEYKLILEKLPALFMAKKYWIVRVNLDTEELFTPTFQGIAIAKENI